MHQFYRTCAYFTAAKYMRTMERLTNQVFRPTNLPPAYSYIMMFIEDNNPTTIMKIAKGLGYDRSSISRMVKKLANLDLLKISQVGRETQLQLTSQGEVFLITANKCLAILKKTTDKVLGADKIEMTRLLSKGESLINRQL